MQAEAATAMAKRTVFVFMGESPFAVFDRIAPPVRLPVSNVSPASEFSPAMAQETLPGEEAPGGMFQRGW
jgi:hypothetical protein